MASPDDINYRVVDGEGTPIVFIHGWLGDNESWNRVDTFLNAANQKLFYDQRCHGESFCEAFSTFEELAEDLDRLIRDWGLDDPVIVGHSMGGMVALTYATHYDTLAGLVLIGTCASTPEPRVKSPQFFLEQLDTMDREEWADMIVQNYMPDGDDHLLRFNIQDEMLEADEPVLRHSLIAMTRYDVRDDLDDVTVPSLVIGAEQDDAITPEKSRELANLLDCQITWLDASHLLLYEEPRAVARLIEDFLDQHDLSGEEDVTGQGHRGTAELKVPDGKLVRADVYSDETIHNVELHGDFFVYPENAVHDVEEAVEGAPATSDVDALAERIRDAIPAEVELVGFDPVHAAQAVKNAIQGEQDED